MGPRPRMWAWVRFTDSAPFVDWVCWFCSLLRGVFPVPGYSTIPHQLMWLVFFSFFIIIRALTFRQNKDRDYLNFDIEHKYFVTGKITIICRKLNTLKGIFNMWIKFIRTVLVYFLFISSISFRSKYFLVYSFQPRSTDFFPKDCEESLRRAAIAVL